MYLRGDLDQGVCLAGHCDLIRCFRSGVFHYSLIPAVAVRFLLWIFCWSQYIQLGMGLSASMRWGCVGSVFICTVMFMCQNSSEAGFVNTVRMRNHQITSCVDMLMLFLDYGGCDCTSSWKVLLSFFLSLERWRFILRQTAGDFGDVPLMEREGWKLTECVSVCEVC